MLTLKTLGIDNVANFEYLDPPDPVSISNALTTLYRVGAIDQYGNMHHQIGKQMAAFPLDPRFSKMLIESVALRASDTALSLVSIISANSGASSDLMQRPNRNASDSEKRRVLEVHQQFDSKYGDLMSWLLLFNHFQKICADRGADGNGKGAAQWAQRHFVNQRTLRTAMKIRNQLEPIMVSQFGDSALSKQSSNPMKAIRRVLARSLFMQSAKRLEGAQNGQHSIFRLMTDNEAVCNRNVFVHPSSRAACSAKAFSSWHWIVYLEVVISNSKPYLRGICSVKYDSEFAKLLPRIGHKVQWNKETQNDDEVAKRRTLNHKHSENAESVSNSKQNDLEKEKLRKEEVDSVKQRYLKRKMLKQRLQSL